MIKDYMLGYELAKNGRIKMRPGREETPQEFPAIKNWEFFKAGAMDALSGKEDKYLLYSCKIRKE
jgi:hypothetical protein